MKANELRIGNFALLDNNKYVKILWFKLEVACIMEIGVEYPSAIVQIERLKPIKFNNEWDLNLNKFETQSNIIFFGNYSEDIDGFFLWISGFKLYIKFVHEIQNLYFSLTNEELNIKQ